MFSVCFSKTNNSSSVT